MYTVRKTGYILNEEICMPYKTEFDIRKNILDDIINFFDGFEPGMSTSSNRWKNWKATLDLSTCHYCRSMHGQLYAADEIIYDVPPAHPNCRCVIEAIQAIFSGYATRNGRDGADYWIKRFGELPDYYISKDEAIILGWESVKGNLAVVAPDMMIGGEIYKNKNGHLPQAEGRIWYEADINYTGGYRTRHRVLFSSDGLIFVTYNHYKTFIEII